MDLPYSPIQSLQQLKALLDEGALTRREYDLLKRKLMTSVLGDEIDQVTEGPPAVAPVSPVGGDLPAGHLNSSEPAEGPAAAVGPSRADSPLQLNVDHLLTPAEGRPTYQAALASPTSRMPISQPEGPNENASAIRIERKVENYVDFSPLRGNEPRSFPFGNGNLLNVILLVSILSLIAFGGYVLLNQQEWESEHITSRSTQSAGGVAPTEDPAVQSGTSVAQPEPALPKEQAPKNKATADPAASAPSGQDDLAKEPSVPVAAPEVETKEPAPAPKEEPAGSTIGERDNKEEAGRSPVGETEKPVPAPPASEEKPVGITVEERENESAAGREEAGQPKAAANEPAAPAPNPTAEEEETSSAEEVPGETSLPPVSEEDQEILSQIENRLRSYYVDFQAKPFEAKDHFAPRVERYYTLTNVTPQGIKENLESYHYNEFLNGRSSFDPSSIRIVNRDKDTYEVVFIEHGQAFRKSRNQHQELTARVRAKFNKNFRMTYYRQERILKNEFRD
jgi:hypothetical protein